MAAQAVVSLLSSSASARPEFPLPSFFLLASQWLCKRCSPAFYRDLKQRNTNTEKADIKAEKVPGAWKDRPVKHDIAVPAFGYKNPAAIDRRHDFILGWNVTSAAAHNVVQNRNVLNRSNTGSPIGRDSGL